MDEPPQSKKIKVQCEAGVTTDITRGESSPQSNKEQELSDSDCVRASDTDSSEPSFLVPSSSDSASSEYEPSSDSSSSSAISTTLPTIVQDNQKRMKKVYWPAIGKWYQCSYRSMTDTVTDTAASPLPPNYSRNISAAITGVSQDQVFSYHVIFCNLNLISCSALFFNIC